jgi:hypothetical protein
MWQPCRKLACCKFTGGCFGDGADHHFPTNGDYEFDLAFREWTDRQAEAPTSYNRP